MNKLKVYNPFDRKEIAEYELMNEEQIENALERAHQLFHDSDKRLPKHQRVGMLEKLGELMKVNRQALCEIAAMEGGKPWKDSMVEVDRAINGVKLAMEHLAKMHGEEVPMGLTPSSDNRIAFTSKEPRGVVLAISAFNHPLNLIVHQVIPAFAVGAPVLVKPASSTPMSCLRFKELMNEAGIPDDWCQVILTSRQNAEKMVSDHRIAFLSFIGSGEVGWTLRSKLPPGASCALEHGGVAPVIVCDDANQEELIAPLLKGGFYHAGQVCVSVQRVYAPEGNAETLARELANAANKLKVGDQLAPDTEVGPLIEPHEVNRLEEWIDEAVSQGATLLCGGKRISDTCFEPTVLYNPPESVNVSCLEVFGPVVCVYSYETMDEAINRANALPFSFQAAVFTQNIDRMLKITRELKARAVMVNDHTAFRVDWMPFGGGENSGIGVGGISHSMDEMSCKKLTVIKSQNL